MQLFCAIVLLYEKTEGVVGMQSLLRTVNRTHRIAMQFYAERLKTEGINGPQQIYLLHICNCPGITQEQMAQHLAVNKSTAARHLAALEEKGWIQRCSDPADKRNLRLFPTEQAKEICPKIKAVIREFEQKLLADFPEEQRQQLIETMEAVQKKAEALWKEELQ